MKIPSKINFFFFVYAASFIVFALSFCVITKIAALGNCPNPATCAEPSISLANCVWVDNCAGARQMSDVTLQNVIISEAGTASSWVPGPNNVTWNFQDVQFGDGGCFTKAKLNFISNNAKSVRMIFDGINMTSSCGTSDDFAIEVTSTVGSPVELEINVTKAQLGFADAGTCVRSAFIVKVPTAAGSFIDVRDSVIVGTLAVNATDIQVFMNDATVYYSYDGPCSAPSSPPFGFQLVSTFRPFNMMNWNGGPVIPNMQAIVRNSFINISTGVLDAEQGKFFFDHTHFTKYAWDPDTLVWKNSEFVPLGGGPPPNGTIAPKPLNVVTFEAHFCTFNKLRLGIVPREQFNLRIFDSQWVEGRINSSPFVRNNSISEYFINTEMRRSHFYLSDTMDHFTFNLWTAKGGVSSDINAYCQGTSTNPETNMPDPKQINVQVIIEDTTMEIPWGCVSSCANVLWGTSFHSSDCKIENVNANFMITRSAVGGVSFERFLMPEGGASLEITEPRKNVSTKVSLGGDFSSMAANNVNFYFRNVPNTDSAPTIRCNSVSSAMCLNFGSRVSNVRWQLEGAVMSSVLSDTMAPDPYKKVAMIPCGMLSCNIDISGKIPEQYNPDAPPGDKATRTPFNNTNVYLMVPFTGNASFTDVNVRFYNNAEVSRLQFNFFNPWTPTFDFTPLPNAPRKVLGSINIDILENTSLSDATFNFATPTYNDIRVNITDAEADSVRFILNESMCDPDNIIPDMLPPMNRWLNIVTNRAVMKLGSNFGYGGLVEDRLNCSAQNILIAPTNTHIYHKMFKPQDVVLYQMVSPMDGLMLNRQISVEMKNTHYNGTTSRLAFFNDVGTTIANIQSGLFPTTFSFQATDSIIALDLPAITPMDIALDPAWSNPRFTFIENVPGRDSTFAINNTKFFWRSGGPIPWMNNGMPNDNYTETRRVWSGYSPSKFIVDDSTLVIEGSMMRNINIVEGTRNPWSRSTMNYFRESDVSITGDTNVGWAYPFYYTGSMNYENDYSGPGGISFHFHSCNVNVAAGLLRTVLVDPNFNASAFSFNSDLSWTSTSSNFTYVVSSVSSIKLLPDSQLSVVDFGDNNFKFASKRSITVDSCKFIIRAHHCVNFGVFFLRVGSFSNAMSNMAGSITFTNSNAQIILWNSTLAEGFAVHLDNHHGEIYFGYLILANSKFNISVPQLDTKVLAASITNQASVIRYAATNTSAFVDNIDVNVWFAQTGNTKSYILELQGKVQGSFPVSNVRSTVAADVVKFVVIDRDSAAGHLALTLDNIDFVAAEHVNAVAGSDGSAFFEAENSNVDVTMTNARVNMTIINQVFVLMLKQTSNYHLSVEDSIFNINAHGTTQYSSFFNAIQPQFGAMPFSARFGNGVVINIQAVNTAQMSLLTTYETTCMPLWDKPAQIVFDNITATLGFDQYTPSSMFPAISIFNGISADPSGSNHTCVNASFVNSVITLDDRRPAIMPTTIPARFLGCNNKTRMGNLTISGNELYLPQHFTWFTTSGAEDIVVEHNLIRFGGVQPAATSMIECEAGLATNCPKTVNVTYNNFQNSVPLTGAVAINNVPVGPIPGTSAFICNKANGKLWQPPSLGAIGYTNSIIHSDNCLTRTKSHTDTIEIPTTSSTTASANTTANATSSSNMTSTTSTTSSPNTTSTTTTTTTSGAAMSSSTTSATTTETAAPSTTTSATTTTTTTVTPAPTRFVNTTSLKSQAVQDATLVKEDTTSAVSSVGATAGMLGLASPTLATVAARVGLLTSLASCEASLDEELPRYINPTGLAIDLGAPRVRYHMGANIANLAILIGVGLLSLLFAAVHTAFNARPEERRVFGIAYRSLGAARFPGCLVFFLLFFSQPFIGSSLTCIFYGNTATACISVFIIVIDLIGGLVIYMSLRNDSRFLATYRTREDLEFDRKMKEREDMQKGIQPKKEVDEESACEKLDKWYERTIEGVGGFWFDVPRPDEALDFETREKLDIQRIKSHVGHTSFSLRWGAAFDYYSSKYRWFIVLEFMATVILGLCDGLVDILGCSAITYILVAIFAIYVLIIFVLRPFCARKDFFFCGVCSLLQLIGGIVTVIPEDSIDPDKKEQTVIIVCSIALFVGLIQAAEGILSDGLRFVYEKFCAADDDGANPEEAAKPVDYNLVTNAPPPILREHSGAYENFDDPNAAPMMIQTSSGDGTGILKMPENSNNNNNNGAYADMPLSARGKAAEYYNNNSGAIDNEMRPIVPAAAAVGNGRHQSSTRNTPEQPPINHPSANQQQNNNNNKLSKYAKDDLDEL